MPNLLPAGSHGNGTFVSSSWFLKITTAGGVVVADGSDEHHDQPIDNRNVRDTL